jgi:hypothetical protein
MAYFWREAKKSQGASGKMVVFRSVGGEMSLFESHNFSGVALLRHEFSPSHERSTLWDDLLGLLARAVCFPLEHLPSLPGFVQWAFYCLGYHFGGIATRWGWCLLNMLIGGRPNRLGWAFPFTGGERNQDK